MSPETAQPAHQAADPSRSAWVGANAGSGKTYTAVAMAVAALKDRRVKKIILTRPAVEAGENLGFLPGDLKEKLDPYLQPLYDALTDMLPYERVADHMEKGVIEVAPLAFMRGRTLDKAFVILDEAQNIKNPQAKQSQAVRALDAGFRIALTGTPVENRLKELWSILDFRTPNCLCPEYLFQLPFVLASGHCGDRQTLGL